MVRSVATLLACLAVLALARASRTGPVLKNLEASGSSLKDFFDSNKQYELMGAALPELLKPDAAVTLLLPAPLNATSPGLLSLDVPAAWGASNQEYISAARNLFSHFVIPQLYAKPEDLAAAGAVKSLANTTTTLHLASGSLSASLGGVHADVIPVAFPVGKSTIYLLDIDPSTLAALGTPADLMTDKDDACKNCLWCGLGILVGIGELCLGICASQNCH
ncbi:hypothetical protein N2152v2_000128 [Parachlorella kessleri]